MAKITQETAKSWRFETKQLHVGQEDYDHATDSRAVPIYQTSSFVFRNSQHAADRFALKDAGNIYGRLTNPTEDIFEQRIAALHGGIAALSVSSGAAAITYAIENVVRLFFPILRMQSKRTRKLSISRRSATRTVRSWTLRASRRLLTDTEYRSLSIIHLQRLTS